MTPSRVTAGPAVPVLARGLEAAGDTLYQNFCTVCHGVAGDAKGPVSSRIGAPSLLTGRARAYSDGYLYSIIRYGRGVMPRYGDKVYQPADRWAIVSHIRKLQAASPGAAGAGRRRGRHPARRPAPPGRPGEAAMSPGTFTSGWSSARSPGSTSCSSGSAAGSPSSA